MMDTHHGNHAVHRLVLGLGLAFAFYCCAPVVSRAQALEPGPDSERISIAVEALNRLKGLDLESHPAVRQTVLKVLRSIQGSPEFVELVSSFQLSEFNETLLEMALNNPTNALGLAAAKTLVNNHGFPLLENELNSQQPARRREQAVRVLGELGSKRAAQRLGELAVHPEETESARGHARAALLQSPEGARVLLKLLQEQKIAPALRERVVQGLARTPWEEIRNEAAKRLEPGPENKPAELPPISELVRRSGEAERGAAVFERPDTLCINCHQVQGRGIDFGPNLSDIGTKLGKDALYQAILEPSAGISFGFEAWQIELKNGEEAFGLVVSETGEEVAVKIQSGLVTRYKKSDIASRRKMENSIMPAGLHAALTVQELVDLIEYLASLRQKESGSN